MFRIASNYYCTPMDHFTVVGLVAWPLSESEAGVDLVLIETLLHSLCKFLLISMRTASLTLEKSREVSIKTGSTPASLSFKGQAAKHSTVKWSTSISVPLHLMAQLQHNLLVTLRNTDNKGHEEKFLPTILYKK